MKVIVTKNYDEMSREAAGLIKKQLDEKPASVLGLATGSTPEGLYNELIRMHKEDGLDFSKVTTFNLDEYVGISKDNESSYHYFMNDKLFNHINVNEDRVHIPKGRAENIEGYCKEYDKMIEDAGGIDVQILGIGENGHIAFNEPARDLNMGTGVIELTESTIEVNSRFFDSVEEVPRTAITMGIGSIMKARKIILLANGERKREIMDQVINSDTISTFIPASILKLHHDVTVIMDEDAVVRRD